MSVSAYKTSMQIPSDITNLILTYLEERQRLTGLNLSLQAFHRRVYAPLLSLNREWRTAVLRRLASECVFTADYPISSSRAIYSYAPELFAPEDYPMGALVRTVTLRLNFEGIADGDVPQLLTSPECPINGFSYATNLNVEIFSSGVIIEDHDEKQVLGYVNDTVSTIRRVLPMARNISVADNMLYPIIGNKLSAALGYLIQQLLCGSTKSSICYSSYVDDTAKYSGLTSLTHIDYEVIGYSKKHMQIIHQNALSLQELSIDYKGLGQIFKLVADNSGTLITYPRLRCLKLSSVDGLAPSSYPVFEDHMPFPRLIHVDLMVDYPFGDDTLFRGNANSLESLRMVADGRVERLLKKYDVFSGNKYKWLKSVRFENPFKSYVTGINMSSKAFMEILSQFPSLEKFEASGLSEMPTLLTQLPFLPNLRLIRVLDLGTVPLSLSNLITLLQTMTRLCVLSCSGSLSIGGGPNAELGPDLDALREEHYPFARQLKVLSLWKYGGGDFTDLGINNLTYFLASFAVICPSFYPTPMDPKLAVRFNKSLRLLIDDNMFAKYSKDLRRLLIAKM
ncbi:hypothetical protein IW146_004085 [Coemansia sp. RSA 922]|nr:hypothetical protein IW146_004085 [Coemansia sp. RSA 922]KAJ2351484.1 hypothetical protein GGH92_001801 [Coemansia sp. RSA 2673]